ncbi:hypothetical protein BRC79_00070 [Halobacteriales archaeon QH_8_67_27]|nr:MAG: hypothetical protein BRC79_00070 [Halobacteriales archaeon QH_8_67_27]
MVRGAIWISTRPIAPAMVARTPTETRPTPKRVLVPSSRRSAQPPRAATTPRSVSVPSTQWGVPAWVVPLWATTASSAGPTRCATAPTAEPTVIVDTRDWIVKDVLVRYRNERPGPE